MIREITEQGLRATRCETLTPQFAVIGGGMTGVCTAIAAARKGIRVVLVQDRPVLGGNASSEVRLWVLGATSHMGNNNRWAREGGIIDEIMVENTFRNREGNPVIFDTLLLDMVLAEKNIHLLLNTIVYKAEKQGPDKIASVTAFNPQNQTRYRIEAELFCDASGDGILAYSAGASYRFGAEEKEEFGECFSPSESYGELLGHTIYLYPKMTDHPVKFIPPSFALKEITALPKYEQITPSQRGCNYWWFEYGGLKDTVHDTEEIKFELWKVVYGAWNYIKNSGKFPEAENMTLEWVGTIPGKRESRRFEGLYMLSQKDIIEQRHFDDAVAFGGWAIDLHPAAGVYSPHPSCNQYHAKGIYEIPYRCYVSRDIRNLFISGRLISASHVAFGSTRVMATSALGGQAVGEAAALCLEQRCSPGGLLEPPRMRELQQRLGISGQSIPGIAIGLAGNKAASARITASSTLRLAEIPAGGKWIRLDYPSAQMLPLLPETAYSFKATFRASEPTEVIAELYVSGKPRNYTPDTLLESRKVTLSAGVQEREIAFSATLRQEQYALLAFRANPKAEVASSELRMTGILSVFNKFNLKVNNRGRQVPPEGSGFESFEFWCPERRPEGRNIALKVTPALPCFSPENLVNGFVRPTCGTNAWAAAPGDRHPRLELAWREPQRIGLIRLYLDTDYDHPMETSQYGHPENVMPFCLRNIHISDGEGRTVATIRDNHQTILTIRPEKALVTDRLVIETEKPLDNVPASMFQILIQ